jgi:hypothetical protein
MASQSPEKYLEQRTFKLIARAASIDVESSPETSLEAKTLVTSLGECELACQQESSFICESLSFCRDGTGFAKCIMSSLTTDEKNFKKKKEATCDVYGKAYLSRFQEIEGSMVGASGDSDIKDVTVEECARRCSLEDKFRCQSIAFCGTECLLKEGHAMIEKVDKTKKEQVNGHDCTLYTGMSFI